MRYYLRECITARNWHVIVYVNLIKAGLSTGFTSTLPLPRDSFTF